MKKTAIAMLCALSFAAPFCCNRRYNLNNCQHEFSFCLRQTTTASSGAAAGSATAAGAAAAGGITALALQQLWLPWQQLPLPLMRLTMKQPHQLQPQTAPVFLLFKVNFVVTIKPNRCSAFFILKVGGYGS